MPLSHSNLHFVNLSKPNGGKDEETRKAVRTHVMQQYIQERRLQEKRRARQTPLEGPAQRPYFVLLGQALIPAKFTGVQSPLLTKWMPLALRCPAPFYGTLLVSSTQYAATRIDKRDETWVLVSRSHAIQALNQALADPHQAISDENIAAVINLVGHELLVGNLPFYTCHMLGSEKIVAMRGSLHTLGLDGLTEALAHWVDQMKVALTGSMPRFPLAPIPSLVPQAKPSVLRLPPPTPPLIKPFEIPSTEVIGLNVPQPVGGDDGQKRPTTSCFSNPTP